TIERVAERLRRSGNGIPDVSLAGHVGGHDEDPPAEVEHLLCDRPNCAHIPPDEDEIAARRGNRTSNRETEPLRRPGHEDGAAGERGIRGHCVRHPVNLRSSIVVTVKMAKATSMLTTTAAHRSPALR